MKINFQLVIDHNDGADLLAVFATVVIALNVAAWWPRTVDARPQLPATVPSSEEHGALAALYARHLTLSQAALLCGLGAIVVGEASFVHAAVVKGEFLTGFAILLVAMVIAVFSLDAQAGLLDGKDLEADVRRDRNTAELQRLRQLAGHAIDGSAGSCVPSARWSDARTAARWSGGFAWLWWVYEVAGIAAVTLLVPTMGLAYVDARSGISWGEIFGSMAVVVIGVVFLGALFIIMMVAATVALVYRHHVMAAAYALIVIVLLGFMFVAAVGQLRDGTAITADRWISFVCGLWLFLFPVLITWRALAKSPEEIGRFPGGVARRLVRVAILSRITQLDPPAAAETPTTVPAAPTTGWALVIQPWKWPAAFVGWYERASGVNHESAAADAPAAAQPASVPAP